MEHAREKFSEFDRFRIIQLLKKNNIERHKKRKLPADELGLPKPKQKCYDQSCPSRQVKFVRGLEADLEYESDPDSAEDGNIIGQDSDSIPMFLEPEKNLNSSMYGINVGGSRSSKEEAGDGEQHIHRQNNETDEDSSEQSITDKELEELLYSYGLKPNSFTIPYASWTHQEDQTGPRRATIDQEFEHYFSMLNL